MNRRNFLKNGSLAGISIVIFSLEACNTEEHKAQNATSENLPDSFEFNEITIEELQKKLSNGELTSRVLTEKYLKRIQNIDKSGPALNSVIEVNPDALSIADAMDNERKNGKLRGLLHGIPVLIKDNIDTADKMQTTAGSLALEGHIAQKDSFVAKKLRESGAVILGKTNLSEWANFRSTRSSSGWSSRGGQTKNPYFLDRSPCGSSSGSAVAVSANLCVVAVGTETDGSIACPASMNGIVGIKPTVGLVSRSGIIPISKTQDTAGPFARTVKDAAILLSSLTGIDQDDKITEESGGKAKQDYLQNLDANGLKGKRIGVEKTLLKHHEGIDAILRQALDLMKKNGAEIIEVEFMNKYQNVSADEFKLLQYEFKDGLNKYLATANARVKSLQDVINFNKQNETKVMPYFKQEIMDSSEIKGGLDSKEYLASFKNCRSLQKSIDEVLEKKQLNAICGPATGAAWCIDFINGDFWTGYGAYGPAAVAGYPSITVPMGDVNGIPIGLSFISKAYDEPGLISIGYAFEQLSKKRKMPQFKKTVG
ncbi:MAG TPA: amidase [Chitinophagaceae bacterium]|jgi:amidase|nr:amidase [Chitinophagaceae bacterium]